MPTSYENQVSSLSPVIWFKFDETSGNAVSSGSKTPTATNTNSVTVNVTSTVSNKCVTYDGTNDHHYYITGATSSNQFSGMNDGIFTIEFWIKGTGSSISTSNNQVVFNHWDTGDSNRHIGGYVRGTGYSNTGKFTYYTLRSGANYQDTTSTSRVDDGKFHHIVIAQNGNTTKMYVDGVLETTKTDWSWTTFGWDANSAVKTIFGAGVSNYSTNATTEYYAGSLDEYAIYGSELTSTNILNNYFASGLADRYFAEVMTVTTCTLPMPVITTTTVVNNTYSSEALTSNATFVMPSFDVSSPISVNADVTTASADSVMPAVSLGTNPNAFGVGTASAELVHPTLDLVSNINYSHSVATADATSPNAVVTTTKAVSYSASPATSSALLGGNLYAGPTVQDSLYSISIRRIGETSNTDGKNGFLIGSQWTNSTLDARDSLALKANSGVPTNGALIKVKFDSTHVTVNAGSDDKSSNTFNVYVFTANPSTTFTTMNYTNLPAKELLYTTRSEDADGFYLDLTRAFVDSRAASYGVFIEHVGTPPYNGTSFDRTIYNGTNLEDKLLYILTSEFTNVNYNAPASTASALATEATIDTQKYVNYSHSVATANANAVTPNIGTENAVTVNALETTASAQAVQPAFSGGITYTSGHLEAFAEGLAFVISTTRNVNIAVDPSTLSALLHMPQAQIGENNSVDHMDASASLPMPLVGLTNIEQADEFLATATAVQPAITTQLRGTVKADPMTARTFVVEPRQYFNYANDKWLKRVYDFQNNQSGYPNVPFLKFFTMPTDIIANATPPGSTSFVDRINFNAEAPQGTIANDRIYSFQTSSTPQKFISWASGGSGKLEVGYFDNQNRKAVRINNIAFQNKATFGLPTGTLSNPDTWSLEMMFKATKQNQVLFSSGPLTISGLNNRTFNMGLYNGKFFATHAVGGPGNDRGIYRAFAWDPIYGAANTTEYASTVVGNRVIGDGNWHHVVIQVIGGRLQVFVDGDLDFQRYGVSNLYPRSFGFGNWSEDANSDFYISTLSISPDTYLSDRDIDLNNFYANGYSVYEATPATATLTMTQDNKARGNRPRALALYWWPKRRAASGAIDRQEDLWDSQGGSKKSEFDYPTFFQTIDYYQQRSQKFYGWDVYAVDVTGSYYSEVVNYDSYSGGVRTFNELIGLGPGQATVTKSARGFRDPITDNRRYIDLINDVDLDQVEAIFFLNYPNESNERDEYSGAESVDSFFNIRESDIYQDFLKSLRAAVDRGINLMVSNSQLAIDLGIVDRVEVVDPLIDGVTWVPGGGYNLDGTPRLPEIAGEPQDDYLRSATLVPGKTVQSNFKDGKWHDLAFNNRLRIVNTIPGITDLMYFTLDDIAYFEVNGQYKFGAPPEFYSRMVYRPNGATVGTEFIMPDASNLGDPGSNDYCRRYLAVPFENVKAGKIVAAFGQNYKRGNETVANPYANYATHIALERGTVLNGKPLGGRIWVTITERPQSSTGTHAEIEMGSDYTINLAHSLGLITDVERTAYLNDPKNVNRQLEAGLVTQSYYNKYVYWTELGFNQSTTVSQGLQTAASQAVQAFGQLFEAIFTGAQKQSAEEAGLKSKFFNYSGTNIIAMVQNFYTFKKVAVPTVTLNGAAFGWIANKEVVPGTQVRDVAGTASAIMVQPTVVGDKLVAQNAQAMVATATQIDPTNYIWTQKNNNYVSLPMLASALINPKLTLIQAAAATATVVLPQNISAYTTDVDEVILYINHVDPILYLREDIVK